MPGRLIVFLMAQKSNSRETWWVIFTQRGEVARNNIIHSHALACRLMDRMADRYGLSDRDGMYVGRPMFTPVCKVATPA